MSAQPPAPPRTHTSTRRKKSSNREVVRALVAVVIVLISSASCWEISRLMGALDSNVYDPCACPQVLHVALNGHGASDITTLDPSAVGVADANSLTAVNLVFDSLVTLDAHMQVVPWGANKITISPDGLTYTFRLRPGQHFSDGAPMHTADYAYTLNRTLDPCYAAPSAVSMRLWAIKDAQTYNQQRCVNGVISPGPHQRGAPISTLLGDSIVADEKAATLTITLARPAGNFLTVLATGAGYALEQSAVTGSDLGRDQEWTNQLAAKTSRKPLGQGGSGMFYIDRWDHQGNLILKANPRWWGVRVGKKPILSEIDFKIYADPADAYAAYTTGETYGYLSDVPADYLADARKLADFQTMPLLQVQAITMNWQIAPFDNLDARQAFCLALNRDALNTAVFGGAMLPTWHLVLQGMPGYNPALTGVDGVTATSGDLARARAHWAAYKWSLHGKPMPALTFTYAAQEQTTDATAQAFASAVVAQWNAAFPDAHLRVKIIQQPPGSTVQTAQLAYSTLLADYADPDTFLSRFAQGNDPLLKQAEASDDPATRLALFQPVEQRIVQQVSACAVAQGQRFFLVRGWARVDGGSGGSTLLTENGFGIISNDVWYRVYLQAH
ncbi:MAG: hypothetical protein OJF49_004373 [Ktedonobacterales bacterium]|nr:MAG: hypothetical protein OJF49_004373 [Ktedonobacterales bacterium]